jgi:repressor LexA
VDRKTTPRQQSILDVIKNFSREHGYPPSVREIGERVGLSSSSTVQCHLRTLEKKGLIKRDPTKPRALVSESDSVARDVVTVPLIGRVAAGLPITAVENIEEEYALPTSLVRNSGSFMLRVNSRRRSHRRPTAESRQQRRNRRCHDRQRSHRQDIL